MGIPSPHNKGRGATGTVGNRYVPLQLQADHEHLTEEDQQTAKSQRTPTRFFEDHSQSIVSKNNSPDIPFRYSINPYRGCEHGCSYCYARPTHEYLGLDPGIDFESIILVKLSAGDLFRQWLARPGYQPATVVFSGVTDCYQPIERQLQLTRQCLEIASECRQPIGVITKNALVTRDIDLLTKLNEFSAVGVAISLPTLRPDLSRRMEPRTSSPQARLRAIEQLSQAGVPVHLMASPVIPGLTDSEIPTLLRAAKEAGAQSASYTLLRLAQGVRQVFLEWLQAAEPDAAEKIIARIKDTRGGQLNQSSFGKRMGGEGPYAEQIAQTFGMFARKLGLDSRPLGLSAEHFRPPEIRGEQRLLF